MHVRLLTSRVLATGQVQTWGDIVELPDEEAQRLIDAGRAQGIEHYRAPAASGEQAPAPKRKK